MLNAAGSATPQGLGTASAGTATAYSREDHVHAVPTFSGDVSNTGTAVTVAKIQNNAVASTTPTSGQVMTWDGTQWAPATNSSGGGGGANGLTYYLNQGTAADSPTTGIPGTPHQLGRTGESAQTTLTSGTLTQNVWTLLAGFVSESTPIDPDVTLIPAGLWDFNVWAFGDANVNAGTSIRCRVYKYNGTTLTEIASPSSDQVINGTSAQYSLSVLVPQTTLELTDRIYVAIEARATGNNHNVTLQFGDSTPSHVHTSLALVGGTGLWRSIAGVLQSPASLLTNADVDAAAGIAWSKIAPSYLGTRVKVVGRDAANIQGCIDLCTDADGEHPYTVLIPPIAGSYSEPLTLKGSVSLIGLTAPLNADAVQITGAHTFTPASAQANTNRINFQNLTFLSSGTSSNTITCSSSTKYFSKFTFSGCIFSGDKSDTYSHLRTDDNVSVYVDNCRFESSAGGSASAGVTQGNGPLYLSNNTTFDVYGRAIDVPVSTTTTRPATVTTGTTTMTLTSGTTTGLVVGMKISGANLGTTVTIVSLTAPSTVIMSTPPKTPGSFTATFGQTPYVEIHDSVIAGKGTETVRLGNGLLTCNTSNFTNTASGGSGINMLTANTVVGIVNSSFTISDATAYTITAAAATCYAALNGISYSSSLLGAYSTLIGANVTAVDYAARATSVANGGTGQTTYTNGQLLIGNTTGNTLSKATLTAGTGITVTNGTGTISIATSGTGNATNLQGGNNTTLLGSVPYQSNTNVTTLLAPNTTATKKFLRQTGTGTNGAAPAWDTVVAGDITGQVAIANGGTGAADAATALANLGAAGTAVSQVFSSNGTWTKPAGAKFVNIQLLGAGGGGGSGRKDSTAGVNTYGGGGGGGGSWININVPASVLAATESVVVGAGGAGAAAVSTDTTSGSAGADGGTTSFTINGSSANSIKAFGGIGGGGGSTSTGAGGAGIVNANAGSSGGAPSGAAYGNPVAVTNIAQFGGPGGSGGGGVGTTNTASNGGFGGRSNTWDKSGGAQALADSGSNATAGNNYPVAATGVLLTGTGGGGGGGGVSVVGGSGGNGGFPAGGGGGGGGTRSGANSGAGGTGGAGVAIITTYF